MGSIHGCHIGLDYIPGAKSHQFQQALENFYQKWQKADEEAFLANYMAEFIGLSYHL